MLFEKALERVAASYPFGTINLPELGALSHSTLSCSDGAKCEVKAARGAKIIFGEGVQALPGASKLTAEGPDCLIAVGAGTSFQGSGIQINGRCSAVIIGAGCRIRGLKIVVRRENSLVVIGAGTTWESGAIISESGDIVAVGNDGMMSNAVVVRTSDGHTIFDAATKSEINASESVFIGHHVWLGNDSRVNKGTVIGSGAVLGQRSIASRSLDANCIYAGIPARKVREGIVWSRTKSYDDIPEEYVI